MVRIEACRYALVMLVNFTTHARVNRSYPAHTILVWFEPIRLASVTRYSYPLLVDDDSLLASEVNRLNRNQIDNNVARSETTSCTAVSQLNTPNVLENSSQKTHLAVSLDVTEAESDHND